MDRLIFATNNKHKLKEVSDMLTGVFDIVGLNELNCFDKSRIYLQKVWLQLFCRRYRARGGSTRRSSRCILCSLCGRPHKFGEKYRQTAVGSKKSSKPQSSFQDSHCSDSKWRAAYFRGCNNRYNCRRPSRLFRVRIRLGIRTRRIRQNIRPDVGRRKKQDKPSGTGSD